MEASDQAIPLQGGFSWISLTVVPFPHFNLLNHLHFINTHKCAIDESLAKKLINGFSVIK